jgi:hypothetical protein
MAKRAEKVLSQVLTAEDAVVAAAAAQWAMLLAFRRIWQPVLRQTTEPEVQEVVHVEV